MKQLINPMIQVPWFSTDGKKNWLKFSFNGIVAQRRVYREIRKYIKRELGRQVSRKWIEANCLILHYEPTDVEDQWIENWIRRIEHNDDDTTETSRHSEDTGCSVEEAGR